MNGQTLPEDFWTRLDQRFDRLYDEIKEARAEIQSVNVNGCAHRKDDVQRIENLESWKTRGIIGVITLFVGLVVEFFGLIHK